MKPSVPVLEFTDVYGNLYQRLIAPPGEFSIRTSADVMTADAIDVAPGAPFDEVRNLPDSILTYLLLSRYCEAEQFFVMANEIVKDSAPRIRSGRVHRRLDSAFGGLQSRLQSRLHVCCRGEPETRGRVSRSRAFGHRVMPRAVHSGAHGGGVSA